MLDFIKKVLRPAKSSVENKPKFKVLLIEDNPVDQRIISNMLEQEGWDVVSAENGTIGIAAAKENKPDVIIMDCIMPELGGLDACKRLKESPDTKTIPVIFITSDDTPRNIVACFEAEAENYLSKPVNAKALISNINHLMSQHSS